MSDCQDLNTQDQIQDLRILREITSKGTISGLHTLHFQNVRLVQNSSDYPGDCGSWWAQLFNVKIKQKQLDTCGVAVLYIEYDVASKMNVPADEFAANKARKCIFM